MRVSKERLRQEIQELQARLEQRDAVAYALRVNQLEGTSSVGNSVTAVFIFQIQPCIRARFWDLPTKSSVGNNIILQYITPFQAYYISTILRIAILY
jgi:hypothetical protein